MLPISNHGIDRTGPLYGYLTSAFNGAIVVWKKNTHFLDPESPQMHQDLDIGTQSKVPLDGNCIAYNFLQLTNHRKYTELQDVQWPGPFSEYVEILSGIALDINHVVPSLKCSTNFNAYSVLLLWTLSPFAIYAAALLLIVVKQYSDAAELYKQVESNWKRIRSFA